MMVINSINFFTLDVFNCLVSLQIIVQRLTDKLLCIQCDHLAFKKNYGKIYESMICETAALVLCHCLTMI